MILLKSTVLADYDDDRETDTVVNTILSYSGRLNTSSFYDNLKSYFLHQTNTFSYDENVKNCK